MTKHLRQVFKTRIPQALQHLYQLCGCETKQERHTLRGCISQMHRNGEIAWVKRGTWVGV
jgi:hypothetical protein